MDLQAWDHLLFILALAAIYTLKEWKAVLILVTAFTIGHSLTLVLATFNVIKFSTAWVEFFIPITICITAIFNLYQKKFSPKSLRLNYFLALFFGLIHGMGFANGLRSLLGKSTDIVMPLLGFNLGLEAGQIVAVLGILLVSWVFINLLGANRKEWVVFASGGAFVPALVMALERHPF